MNERNVIRKRENVFKTRLKNDLVNERETRKKKKEKKKKTERKEKIISRAFQRVSLDSLALLSTVEHSFNYSQPTCIFPTTRTHERTHNRYELEINCTRASEEAKFDRIVHRN